MRAVHPGEILKEEYMLPLNLSASELAFELQIPASQISEIIAEQRGITVDTALRLAKFFGTDLNLWINLQARYEADSLSEKTKKELERIEPYSALHGEEV